MKKTIHIETDIEVEFDENSTAFKNTLEAYKIMFSDEGKVDELLQMIASNIARYGKRDNIECIGTVSVDGRGADADSWCGVDICEGDFDLNGMLKFDCQIEG